jgi:hypothetical protein
LTSIYGEVKLVLNKNDLEGLEILFIGDDHYSVHKNIFHQQGFVEKCNSDDIKVVVMTPEKIFNSVFPWNEDNYKYIQKFKHLYHYTYDIDDCIKLNTKLHRLAMSRHFKNYVNVNKKEDSMVFVGNTKGDFDCYKERRGLLQLISNIIPVNIYPPTIGTWEDYLFTIGSYRFVLSPLGNANALVTRFYEILLVKSIPVQQVKENTLSYYSKESTFEDCIFFHDPEEIPDKIKNFNSERSHNEFWLEDYLTELLQEDNLL